MNVRTTTRPLVVRLNEELSSKLSQEAKNSGKSASSLASEVVEAFLLKSN